MSATVRMNVQRLRNGKLWVVAPVAPTGECLSLLKDIGEVEHLVLPVTALEHKAFFGPFQRQFPSASVWAAPGQYGPFGTLGFSPETSHYLSESTGCCPSSKDRAAALGWKLRPRHFTSIYQVMQARK